MIYVYGFCDGNSVHAVAEYQQRFPNRGIPTRRVFTRVYQTLRDTGTFPGLRIAAELNVNEGVDEEEGIVQMVQSSPRASTRGIARRLRVPHTRVWRKLHAEGMYPYHVQRVQHLGPGDFVERLEFCKWFNGSRQLHRYILFTDDSQFNRDGVNNTHKSHVWADNNSHATVGSNFQQVFSVNVWCALLDIQLIGPVFLEGHLTGGAYLRLLQEKLPRLLEDVSLNKRGRTHFQHDGAQPHSSREVRNFLNYHFPGRWIGRGGPHNWPARSPGLSALDYCVWGWMKELDNSVKVVTRDELLGRIFGYRRPHQKQPAETTTSNPRSSQPSGNLCCGRRWHFRKPALNTDHFKLKVFSRS